MFSRKAKRNRWSAITFSSRSISAASPVAVMASAVSPARSAQVPKGSAISPFSGVNSTGTLWPKCLHSCCRYRLARLVWTVAVLVGMGFSFLLPAQMDTAHRFD